MRPPATPQTGIDATSLALLAELQADARISYSELGRRVHLSAPAVAERVRRLEEAGIIAGYHAEVDATRIGWGIHALVQMPCHGNKCVLRDERVRDWPEIIRIERVTGDTCSVLRVMTPSVEAFEDLIDRLAVFGRPSSAMVLSTALSWKPVTLPPGDG
jgi:Lrp/AsnC family leucine-responsive transcriptional regulator